MIYFLLIITASLWLFLSIHDCAMSFLSQRMQSMFGLEMPLSSLLIKPVQRITKYPLLLKVNKQYSVVLPGMHGAHARRSTNYRA